MFVGMMILVGWVAINEEARMQAFVRQHTGRSIERGAELFASLCSECHGEEGYGADNRAPGLNNPHLFGFDPVGLQTAAVTSANRTLVRLNKETEKLVTELTNAENPPRQTPRTNYQLPRADGKRRLRTASWRLSAEVARAQAHTWQH